VAKIKKIIIFLVFLCILANSVFGQYVQYYSCEVSVDKDSITTGICDKDSEADKIFLNVTPDVAMDRIRRLPGCDCDTAEFTGSHTLGTCYCSSGYDVYDKTCTDSGGKDYKAEIVCGKEVALPPIYSCQLSVVEADRPSITHSDCGQGSLILEVNPAVDMTYTDNFPGCSCGVAQGATATTGSCTCQPGFHETGITCFGPTDLWFEGILGCEEDEILGTLPEFKNNILIIALICIVAVAVSMTLRKYK
jgi:hypothetical protein